MGGSAFSRCAASSLSCSVFPASLLLYLFLPFWGLSPVCCIVSLQLRLPCIASPALFPSFFEGFSRCAAPPHLHRLTCTVSPALSPLHCLPCTPPSPHCLSCTSPLLFGDFPLSCIPLLFRAGCLVACGPTPGRPQRVRVREEGSILFRPQTGGGLSSPPRRDGADLFPAPAGGQCIPFPCRRAQKKSGPRCEVRSSL